MQTAREDGPVFNGDHLLALSKFLQRGEREYETEVRGGSMGATLPEGSRIRVRFAPDASVVEGDVIAYVVRNRIVAHRVVGRAYSCRTRYLVTRGDATVLCDPPVTISALIGIVTQHQRDGEWLPLRRAPLLRHPRGAALLAQTVAAVLRISPVAARWTALLFVRMHFLWVRLKAAIRNSSRFLLDDHQ